MVRAVKTRHEFENTLRVPLIQIACRFVGQQQSRPIRQRSGNRNSLLLPARQLSRALPCSISQSHFA